MTAPAPFAITDLDQLANEVLTLVELAEARTLGWGFVQVQRDLAADLPILLDQLPPLGQQLWRLAQEAGVTHDQILENLTERLLIVKTHGGYKSRFAETVRLLLLLRQRFSFEDWQDAPRLVSDLRLEIRRRRYPRRDTPAAELLAELEALPSDGLERAAAAALLTSADGAPLALARFQREATLQTLHALRRHTDSGLVISAGTGAGKTKAFYIPALAYIAARVGDAPWTKALAIYPRIELLKDQLAEAFGEARKLDGLLGGRGLRPITIAAYYGDTPISANWLLQARPPQRQGWEETNARDGWIFPSMPCPTCQADLIWRREDVEAEARDNRAGDYGRFARLQCGDCGSAITSQHLLLTREQLVRCSPDVLFTTTEMLNRRLSRASEHILFGVQTEHPPRLMLLDEVHTYEGQAGAQVAHLLRRWRHARSSRSAHSLVVVGLSATLIQAESFFSRLTGLPVSHVFAVAPREEDLIDEGAEYNVVLKGDPVSGASLLSTSVQTNMLLARILDTPYLSGGPISRGAYGQKVFAFTDTLDVINRWYHIEYDAEIGQQLSQWRRRPPRAGREELRQIHESGQYWRICEQIGHDLEAPLILDLTSSQYRGVDRNANLVVATSALEVGFNDPDVGAVVQHKAPRSLASFLQRKGRAGRTRAMRPWMVVVTSAYGRDRWAFQHAERLFSPSLPPIELPLDNSYVRAIQAAYTLMDWLALWLRRSGELVDVWRALGSADRGRGSLGAQRGAIARLLAEVLEGGAALDDLREHLRAALALGDDSLALDLILWGEPRPLLTEVIPTTLRQLETSWQTVVGGAPQPWNDGISADPLPDFVPPNLFSLLSLPELALRIPEGRAADAPLRDEHMALAQGMVEFAPGHVSKRFARKHQIREAHWLALPPDDRLANGTFQIRDLRVDLDPTPRPIALGDLDVLVYRPRGYTLSIVPPSVRPTSSARLLWRSRFEPQRRGASGGTEDNVPVARLALASDSPWRAVLSDVCAFLQTSGSWVEVLRMAGGVRAETRYENGTEHRRRLLFADGESSAALGFSMCVDALRFRFQPLDAQRLLDGPDWPSLRQHLAPGFMLHRITTDARLQPHELSDFEQSWLWQLELSMLVAVAVARAADLPSAAAEVRGNRAALARRTMDVIFQAQRFEQTEDEIDRTGRLRQRLLDLTTDPAVADALEECAAVLWSPPDSLLASWLQDCYAASLGAALLDAVSRLVPDIDRDELVLDVEDDTVWISEQTPGGIGVVSRIAAAIDRRPRDLDLQMADTLRHCEREQLAWQLAAVAESLGKREPLLTGAFAEVRAATDLASQTAALRSLVDALEQNGVPATRDLIVALNAKQLRPSADTDSDELVAELVRRWQDEQRRLGCAIDLRVMAVAARRIEEIEQLVQRVLLRVGGADTAPTDSQIFNLLQSLLWLDCRDSCPDCIDQPQPYQRLPKPSRALLQALLKPSGVPIEYGTDGWEERTGEQLAEHYACRIECDQSQAAELRERLTQMLTAPVEIGFQQHYPTLDRVERDGRRWLFGLAIRELAQR